MCLCYIILHCLRHSPLDISRHSWSCQTRCASAVYSPCTSRRGYQRTVEKVQ